MAGRANLALMTTVTGGAGDFTLVPVTNWPEFTTKFGAGTTTIKYVARAPGYIERGSAVFNGTTKVLGRAAGSVVESWKAGDASMGTVKLTFPTTGVTVFTALGAEELDSLENDVDVLESAMVSVQATVAGLVIGSTVQGYSAKLAALSALTWANDRIIYLTGTATAAIATATSFGRSLLALANLDALLALLGTGTPGSGNYLRGDGTWSTPSGSGDVSSNTTSSVDGELAAFSGTGGKTVRRFALTGLLKSTSGLASAATPGTDYYAPGSTDVAVSDGGTGASTASGARTNLGVAVGTDVQAFSAKTAALAAATWAADSLFYLTGTATGAVASLTSFGRLLLALADVAALKALLGYTSAAPSGTGDMPVYTGSVTEFQTPAQVRGYLDVTNLVTVPYLNVPANGDEPWVLRMRGTGTIDSLTHKGTGITVAVKINSTAVTGLSAVTPTGTKATTNATAANTWADGDEINLTFSGASSPTLLAMTLNGTRTS